MMRSFFSSRREIMPLAAPAARRSGKLASADRAVIASIGNVDGYPEAARALARASRGAGIVAFVGLYMVAMQNHVTHFRTVPPNPLLLISLAVAIAGVAGVYWFVTGAARSRGCDDGRLIAWAYAKLAFGLGVAWWGSHAGQYQFAFAFVAVWCLVTGVTKLALLARQS